MGQIYVAQTVATAVTASEAVLWLALVHELGQVIQSSMCGIVWQEAAQSHCTLTLSRSVAVVDSQYQLGIGGGKSSHMQVTISSSFLLSGQCLSLCKLCISYKWLSLMDSHIIVALVCESANVIRCLVNTCCLRTLELFYCLNFDKNFVWHHSSINWFSRKTNCYTLYAHS